MEIKVGTKSLNSYFIIFVFVLMEHCFYLINTDTFRIIFLNYAMTWFLLFMAGIVLLYIRYRLNRKSVRMYFSSDVSALIVLAIISIVQCNFLIGQPLSMKIKHTVERITDFFFSIVTKKDRHYADILMRDCCMSYEKETGDYCSYRKRSGSAENLIVHSGMLSNMSDVAIVIQGPLILDNHFTLNTVKLYKRYYPGCKVIVSTSYVNPYVSMEYYAYHTVHELFLYGDLTLQQYNIFLLLILLLCSLFVL